MKSFDTKMRELAEDIFGWTSTIGVKCQGLAGKTRVTGWASDIGDGEDRIGADLTKPSDIAGKQIDQQTWTKAFFTAVALAKLRPSLERPVVGAHPDGFVTLTWLQGEHRMIDVQLRPEGYRWAQKTPTGVTTIQSDSLEDVAESMRTVFQGN